MYYVRMYVCVYEWMYVLNQQYVCMCVYVCVYESMC